MERKAFMCDMILTELEDVVGVENVSTSKSDRAAYGVDYFWIGRMWVDRGEKPPMPDWIVRRIGIAGWRTAYGRRNHDGYEAHEPPD